MRIALDAQLPPSLANIADIRQVEVDYPARHGSVVEQADLSQSLFDYAA
jgi:hypothetical protein